MPTRRVDCWLGDSPYNCRYCGGNIEVESGTCNKCDETGWDPHLVDLAGFQGACRALRDAGSWEWIEAGTRLGRRNHHTAVAVADYLRAEQ